MLRPFLCVALSLLLALLCLQDAAPGSPQEARRPPMEKPRPGGEAPARKPAKKVWTNENLGELASKSGVSVVGAPSTENPAGDGAGKSAAPSAQERQAQRYRERLVPLRAEIEHLDAEIRKLRDFRKDGTGATGGLDISRRSLSMSPENDVQQLEKRRSDIQSKIDALEEQARRDGVPPGALR